MTVSYVEQRDGVYKIAGSRVSLDSVVYAFVGGQSAESIAQAFPTPTLEQVYGAIAFYLAHRDEVDRYLKAQHDDFEAIVLVLSTSPAGDFRAWPFRARGGRSARSPHGGPSRSGPGFSRSH